ncbi:type II secretion system protein GspD [Hafnia paralvei]|uniref:type II secretion system protein GspD n=1 Tax=Hafnia paralvei TaxID=546367 RepID=UPI000DF13C28|nr:type II secretion system protein GspD [Hafnia paralvei]RDA72704.1 type II secretion system protein GspD [Hafnia paralvei]RDA73215.1 type II secretion system protein GspD [Hafnia paralvei]RDA73467.1 type II secretion system protein GspD [Hafnia paralvei]RDA81872.1 type II secretion system protein GspD [Hafnia paralvei]RDA82153.1 type II secretion system protein GspD [Hafnia paralvei]
MIKYMLIILLFFSPSVMSQGVTLELNRVTLPEVIHMLYSDVFNRPYMLAPELAGDTRILSLRITPDVDERAFIERYFGNLGIKIFTRDGIDYVAPVVKKTFEPEKQVFVYRPHFRSVAYLSELLRTFVEGSFSASGSIGDFTVSPDKIKPGTATDKLNRSGDKLVFYGTRENIRRIERILPEIDIAGDEVFVGGYVFEVQTKEQNGSGLALAAKLLSGKVSIGMGNLSGGYENFIRIGGSSLDAMYELFRTDSRFKVVSSPRLRVKSGYSATFSVGQEVPVLSGVEHNNNSSYQSVQYRSSGVILDVQPEVHGDVTDVKIKQQLSNFVQTDTGVNNSPTLIKREVETFVSVKSGDIILLGGLAETKNSDSKTGFSFLPRSWMSSSDENSKTDILILLQVRAESPVKKLLQK